MHQSITFPSGTVQYLFASSLAEWLQGCDFRNTILIADERVAALYPDDFILFKTLIIPSGETSKDLDTISRLAAELLQMEATKKTFLIGVGGGVVTDIVGFLASVYMRGVHFGFVPTTLLSMVDAAIGGKNGVNIGMHKNIAGTIKQPEFILFDTRVLSTLPEDEWSSGFAEIIKYACIFDPALFEELETKSISYYKEHDNELSALIMRCVAWKNKTVLEDEKENGIRKLLNFGHTAGHAIENLYELPHGNAIAIGMIIACAISEEIAGLDTSVRIRLRLLLDKYHLPVRLEIDVQKAMEILKMDKKRVDNNIDYILLDRIGKAVVRSLPFDKIEDAFSKV